MRKSEEEFLVEVSRRLLKARENSEHSVDSLAMASGVAADVIKRHERLARRWPDIGASRQNYAPPAFFTIVRIVQVLGLSYDDLLEGLVADLLADVPTDTLVAALAARGWAAPVAEASA